MSALRHPRPEAAAPVGGPLLTPVTGVLAVLVLAMLGVLAVRFVYGLGAVTNLNNGYPWGIWIAFDEVTGTALASGGFTTALLVYVLNRGEYHPIVRPALVAALFGYTQAGISVFSDLGRWWNFWHIFWPKYTHLDSVLFEVSLCITGYVIIAWIEFTPIVLERLRWDRLRKKLNKVLFVLVAVGVVLPTIYQSALGSLLVVFGPQIHPLYQSDMLPLFFLISCVGMGFSAVLIEGSISSLGLKRPFEKELLGKLLQIGRLLVAIFLVVRFADLTWRRVWPYAFQATAPALSFWLETALLSVPLWLLWSPASRRKARLLFLSAMAMAVGGLVYRISAFLVAYDTGPGWRYFPSIGEITVTVGLIAFEVLAIIIAIRLLPILPGTRTRAPAVPAR